MIPRSRALLLAIDELAGHARRQFERLARPDGGVRRSPAAITAHPMPEPLDAIEERTAPSRPDEFDIDSSDAVYTVASIGDVVVGLALYAPFVTDDPLGEHVVVWVDPAHRT